MVTKEAEEGEGRGGREEEDGGGGKRREEGRLVCGDFF
mgnify:CR=1 FL=1